MKITRKCVAVLCIMLASIISGAAAASSLKTLYSFTSPGHSTYPDSDLLHIERYAFGESSSGGTHDNGTLYRIDLQTGAETILYNFTYGPQGSYPQGGLVFVEGKLYGVTYQGGSQNLGTVFAFDIATSTQSVVYSFLGGSDGARPYAGLINVGGTLYGTTASGGNGCGTIFAVNPSDGVETVVHRFAGTSNPDDGCYPQATLLHVGGVLYGTTTSGGTSKNCTDGCGTIFAYTLATGTESLVHSFIGTDGDSPASVLIEAGGQLYGTAEGGGKYEFGTVFQTNPTSGATTVLHSFAGGTDGNAPNGSLVEAGGLLYGTTYKGGAVTGCYDGCGTLFDIDPASKTEHVFYSFAGSPVSDLTAIGDSFSGITSTDGIAGCGTVFEFAPATGTETVLHNFSGCVAQNTSLAAVGSSLIATAAASGNAGFGAIIKLTPTTNVATTLYNFTGTTDGLEPASPVISAQNSLYGVTPAGGATGQGVVYQINPGTKTETVLHAFQGRPDGCKPNGPLIDVSGALYGTTACGGEYYCGAAFKLSLSTGAETVITNFGSVDLSLTPEEGLTRANGTFYGVASYSSVFKINVATGNESIVVGPNSGPGGNLVAQPINVNGILYGTSPDGVGAGGSVFALNPITRAVTILYKFAGGSDGSSPEAPLLYDNGVLYGTTRFGGAGLTVSAGYGIVFSLTIATGVEKILYTFSGGADGANPSAALVLLGGKIYGTTNAGGAAGAGTIFELTP